MGTSFWTDQWGGGAGNLRSRFPRLYHLCQLKEGRIGNMGEWADGVWSWQIPWRRPPVGRDAEAAQQLGEWLGSVAVKGEGSDYWRWGIGGDGLYSVRKAYAAIDESNWDTGQQQSAEKQAFVALWKTDAPQKQKVVCWRQGAVVAVMISLRRLSTYS